MRTAAFALCIIISSMVFAQKDSIHGLRFVAFPIATYDSDLGLKVGILGTAYQFGDGSLYPDYLYNLSYEINYTTKGSAISQLFFDSGKWLKMGKHRVVADFSYIHEQATDFYGFNGDASDYVPAFENDEDSQYISRMFYNFDRSILRITADWHEQLNDRFVLVAGIHHYGFKQKSVDIDRLNKGKEAAEMLPDTASLYDLYGQNGIINPEELNGGNVTAIRAGLVYDTRDVEFNPSSGQWLECMLSASPKLPWIETPFLRASVILRNYLPLSGKKLTLATRVGWQDNIGNQAPFYFMPYISQSFCNNSLVEGLGGGKTLRGILRNRIWGDGFMYGNVELRWSIVTFEVIKQKLELKLKPFYDFGVITDLVDLPMVNIPQPMNLYQSDDRFHQSAGAGIHIIINDNFVFTVDYGRCFNANDGDDGLYIGTGFLF